MNGVFRVSSTLKNIIINTGWLFFMRFLRIAFAFFVGVWLARYLGPDQFGILSYALAFVALFWPITRLGLDPVLVQELVKYPSKKDEIMGTAFYLKLAGGIVSMIMVVGAIMLLRPLDALTRALTAVVAFGSVFQAYDAIDIWFQAKAQNQYPVYAKSVALVLCNVAKVVLILAKASLMAFAWVSAVEYVIISVGLVIAYRATGSSIRDWRASVGMAKRLLTFGWPMILASAFALIYLKIDQVMLGQMVGENEVGIYSTAVRISEVWYFVPIAITTAVFPYLVQSKSLGQEVYRARLQQLYDSFVWISLSVAVVMTFAAHFVVRLLFGEAYARAGTILEIHIWAGIFVFLREALGRWFIMEDLLQFSFLTNALGAVANVVLNLLLIPRYAGVGAAIATVISYAAAGYLACFVHPKTRKGAAMMSRALIVPLRAAATVFKRAGKRSAP